MEMEASKLRRARILMQQLRHSSGGGTFSSSLAEIRVLSREDPEIRLPLADLGLIPILTHILLHHNSHNSNNSNGGGGGGTDDDRENACATLLNMSISNPESVMSTPSLLPSLSAALEYSSDNPSLPPLAAATLYSLLKVEAYRPIIGSKLPILSSLINHTTTSTSTSTTKDSLKALFALTLYPLNRPALVSLGAVPALFSLVLAHRRSHGLLEDATAVIAQVAGCYECIDAFRNVQGVRILVGLMDCGDDDDGEVSERVRDNAAAALLNLVMSGGEKAAGDVREVEYAEDVVREMAEAAGRRSERGRKKARDLLRVLEESGRRRRTSSSSSYSDESTFKESSSRCSTSRSSSSSNYSSSVGSSSLF